MPANSYSIKSTANPELSAKITAHLNDLTKPQGSLGRLEDIALQYCLCRGDAAANITAMKVFAFAGDHGITDEKVGPYPKEVTRQMVLNMLGGGAAISVLCKNGGIDYSVVDMGVDADFDPHPLLIQCKVGRGTANFAKEPAMSIAACQQAVDAGNKLAQEYSGDLIGIGEMGIGNSSSAAALYSMLLQLNPTVTVGMGTGSTGPLLEHKIAVISRAVNMHQLSWDGTAFDALRRVGGYEIAGMTGIILGAAQKRIPVVVDGFIASAAALAAIHIAPLVKEYLFFAHASAERFHAAFLDTHDIRPILNLGMRLGEGSGAALAMQVVKQSLNCYHSMTTFSGAGVSGQIASAC